MIYAEATGIALLHNMGRGISNMAEGFLSPEGDNVVILADQFLAKQFPWLVLQDRGVELRRVVMPPGRLDNKASDAVCDTRT